MDRLLDVLARLSTKRPRRFLVIVAGITLPALWVAAGIRVSTSRSALVRDDLPYWQSYMRFSQEFGLPEDLIVVVQSEDPSQVRAFSDDLAARLREEPEVGAVFHRVALDTLAERAPLFLEPAQIDLLDRLASEPALARLRVARQPGERLDALASLIDRAPALRGGAQPGAAEQEALSAALKHLILQLRRFARRGGAAGQPLEIVDRAAVSSLIRTRLGEGGLDAWGYLSADGGRTGVLFVRPADPRDAIEVVRAFVGRVRQLCDGLLPRHPGARCGLTGVPANQIDELHALNATTLLTTVIALIGVALLFLAYFRTLKLLLLATAPVLVALIWAGAAVRLLFDDLNMISSVLMALIVGMGIDFAIHLSARFLEHRHAGLDLPSSAAEAVRRAGRGILTGGLTSAGAFAAIGLSDFKGMAEMGLGAAVGLVVALLASLTVLPALLCLTGSKIPTRAPGFPQMRALAGAVLRHRRSVLAAAVGLTGLMAWLATRVGFDYSIMNLMPTEAESVRLFEELRGKGNLSANAVAAVAPSLADARRLEAGFRAAPTVDRTLGPGSFLPEDQEPRLSRLRAVLEHLNTARQAAVSTRMDRSSTLPSAAEALDALEDALERIQDLAFRSGRPGAPGATARLEEALDAVADVRELLKGDRAGRATAGLAAFGAEAAGLLEEGVGKLRAAVARGPMTPRDLPEGIRGRFVSPRGRYAVYAFPSGDVYDRGFLTRFITDLRRVAPEVTGFPVTYFETTTVIFDGFLSGLLYAAIAVLLLLLLDLRSPRAVAFAVLPLVLGAAWMAGGMEVLRMHYNLANVVGFPLILGVGVDTGVHLLHRWRQEGDAIEATMHTGGAVLLSSLTTMVAFGSVMVAPHRGLASFGAVLVLGVGACTLSALTVFPALLGFLDARRQE